MIEAFGKKIELHFFYLQISPAFSFCPFPPSWSNTLLSFCMYPCAEPVSIRVLFLLSHSMLERSRSPAAGRIRSFPLSAIRNNYLLSAKTYQLSANSLYALSFSVLSALSFELLCAFSFELLHFQLLCFQRDWKFIFFCKIQDLTLFLSQDSRSDPLSFRQDSRSDPLSLRLFLSEHGVPQSNL